MRGSARPSSAIFAFIKTNGLARHNRRNRVFINQLALTVSAQQNAKIIKPSDHPLKFHTIYQENCYRNFGFTNVVKKRVLQILLIRSHYFCLTFALFIARDLPVIVSMSGARRKIHPPIGFSCKTNASLYAPALVSPQIRREKRHNSQGFQASSHHSCGKNDLGPQRQFYQCDRGFPSL
jgi:hypothetical protein